MSDITSTDAKQKPILAVFGIRLTASQRHEINTKFLAAVGKRGIGLMVAFQPQSDLSDIEWHGRIRVAVLSKEFGDKLNKIIQREKRKG